jgi:hypothetical protein
MQNIRNVDGYYAKYTGIWSHTGSFGAIHKLIPNSQLAIIPNCNHVCLILYPEMFSTLVLPFLLQN